MTVGTKPIADYRATSPDLVVVSSSWTPETHHTKEVGQALRLWVRRGAKLGALDTGAFILARVGLLKNKRATVHYEHLDALGELFDDITPVEELFVVDDDCLTCCGGTASVDMALYILRGLEGESIANATARYLFHHTVRGPDASQNPAVIEPFGQTTPSAVRNAIDLMEGNLENPLTIPKICDQLGISQRHLGRLFKKYVQKSPVEYYRDIRLDRARGLVTQTEMKLSQVAIASGFSTQVHFSRAYSTRFGLSPMRDRIEGRVPFEFRAWPMHDPTPH